MDQYAHTLVFLALGLSRRVYSQMESQSVDQCAVVIAVSRVDDHTGRFVNYQKIIIFINYVKWDIFRKDLGSPAPVWHHEPYNIAWSYYQVRLGDFVSDPDITLFYGALDPVTGGVLQVGGHEFIHSHGGLAWIDVEPEMLEHPLFSVFKEISFLWIDNREVLIHG